MGTRDKTHDVAFYLSVVALIGWIAWNLKLSPNRARTSVVVATPAPARPASRVAMPIQELASTPDRLPFQDDTLSTARLYHAGLNESALKILKDPAAPLSSVCDKLSRTKPKASTKKMNRESTQRFDDSILGRIDDPAIESALPALRYVFTEPDLQAALARNDSRISTSEAYNEIKNHRDQLEYVMDQSYLLYMLVQSVEARPVLATDPQVLRYCNELEGQLNHFVKADFKKEKKAFTEFLAAVKIDPAEIEFDPEYQSNLMLEINGNSLTYNTGWLNKLDTPL